MEKYKLSLEDVWQGEEHLSNKVAATGYAEGWSERFDQSERELEHLLTRLQGDIEKLDPTLLDTLQHVKEKMKYQMERLRGKLSRAALGRSDLLVRHVQALSRFLMPHKDLQERRVGGAYFLGRAGYELLDRLLEHIQVRCSDHQTLQVLKSTVTSARRLEAMESTSRVQCPLTSLGFNLSKLDCRRSGIIQNGN